jgi:hypothetical protein
MEEIYNKMRRFVLTMMTAAFTIAGSGMLRADEHEGRIQQRKENQQARIGHGVANGSLTARETANLEHKEAKLNKEIRTDRMQNGGNLTNNEKRQINRQQNRLSKNIYNDKHNDAHQPR